MIRINMIALFISGDEKQFEKWIKKCEEKLKSKLLILV